MGFEPFAFTKSWENDRDFPTYEPDESQVRADLQCLHDEARDGLNRLIGQLNQSGAALLPFAPEGGLTAETVQEAILEVHEKVREAAAGQLVDGTVGREKLTGELLERVYGGRVLVSLEEPGQSRSPDTDYPLGQLWLRPAATLINLAGEDWEVSGCTMEETENGWALRCDGSTALVSAGQSLPAVGQAGQRVLVYLSSAPDSRMSALELYLNGVEHDLLGGERLFETALDQTGSLELQLSAQWPLAVADGAVGLTLLTVVNVEALEEGLPGVAMPERWQEFLERYIPFSQLALDTRLYQQTAPGQWATAVWDILPVARGGTGLGELPRQRHVKTDGAGALAFLTAEELVGELGSLRVMTGGYTGTGEGRTETLPVAPKLLYLFPKSGAITQSMYQLVCDNPMMLADGASRMETWVVSADEGYRYSFPKVSLSGSELRFSVEGSAGSARLGNRNGVSYGWMAVY